MLIEMDHTIGLSTEEPLHHSRPSLDISFASTAEVYGIGLTSILLSGANQDGTKGVMTVKQNHGAVIIQDPGDCEIATMCESALKFTTPDHILSASEIIEFVSFSPVSFPVVPVWYFPSRHSFSCLRIVKLFPEVNNAVS